MSSLPPHLEPLSAPSFGPIRAWSWIVTILGDLVEPRGGEVALASLTRICGSLGIEAGLVRTALTRLVADGLLERRRIGKGSYYRLAPAMAGEVALATQRIYFGAPQRWGGGWRLAILPVADRAEGADEALSTLRHAGFGPLAPNVLIAPLDNDGQLASGRTAAADPGLVFLDARGDPAAGPRLAAGIWRLERLAGDYAAFRERFGPICEALEQGGEVEELLALRVRVALIHAFRRVVLHDPLLPPELLPAGWPGHAARQLCAAIYGTVRPASERWLDLHAIGPDGSLPRPDQSLYLRFAAP